jgi:hydroxymethylbilane synthase
MFLSMSKKYIVATRPSLLAYTQTEQTVNLLRAQNPDCEYEIVKFSTHGDKVTDKPLTAFGGTGVFVKELENAILEGKADFAIHSLKDVPSIQPDELVLASFPQRESPCDVVLTRDGKTVSELGENCVIGTGSPRRIVQIAAVQPTAEFKEIRGNIDTRLQKLADGQYDAIVLAAAGLNRLGKSPAATSILSTEVCLPAIGQGAIAIECRKDDAETIQMLRSINHTETEIAIKAERSFMLTVGGGCKFPLAAYATISGSAIHLEAMTGDHKAYKMVRLSEESTIDKAVELGKSLAEKIIAAAADNGIIIQA